MTSEEELQEIGKTFGAAGNGEELNPPSLADPVEGKLRPSAVTETKERALRCVMRVCCIAFRCVVLS